MSKIVKILGLSGSLRAQSWNTAALRYAAKAAPKNAQVTVYEGWGDLPAFNQDNEQKLPAEVQKLKALVRSHDAILYAVPEYNYGLPGAFKNVIDWLSRPYGDNALQHKPAGIMSASVGMLGGARAQYQLRQCFVFLQQQAVTGPEIMIPFAANKFDPKTGELTDAATQGFIAKYVQNLVDFTLLQQGAAPKSKL